MTELEDQAERVLKAVSPEGEGFREFMELMPALATESESHTEFVARTAPILADHEHVNRWFRPWAERIFRAVNFGGEDDMVGAVTRRSQLEFAYELFRGTLAEAVFDGERDEESDNLLATRASELGIVPPKGMPRSHRWWDWT
jgi:hypothetical protein